MNSIAFYYGKEIYRILNNKIYYTHCQCCGIKTDNEILCLRCSKRKTDKFIKKCKCGKWVELGCKCYYCGRDSITQCDDNFKIGLDAMENVNLDDKQRAIKAIVEITGVKLSEAKAIVDDCYNVIDKNNDDVEDDKMSNKKDNQTDMVENDNKTIVDLTKQNTCLLCGGDSNGYHFCRSCYYKYHKKDLFVRIINAKELEILDAAYSGKYKCKDGHIVKSIAEKIIDDYLFDNSIAHAYEKALPIDENPEHDLHPDFCLQNFKNKGDVYIEHWGFENGSRSYDESEKYKLEIYKKRGITLICTYTDDTQDITASLDRKLEFFECGKINYLKK